MKKIVHFEDEEMLANMYAIKFRNAGFNYKYYLNPPAEAKELVEQVLKEKPNLILMSITMPVMSGLAATEILKKDKKTKDIPIIFLTNHSQKEDINRANKLGAVKYLVKATVVPSEVIETCKEFFDNKENIAMKTNINNTHNKQRQEASNKNIMKKLIFGILIVVLIISIIYWQVYRDKTQEYYVYAITEYAPREVDNSYAQLQVYIDGQSGHVKDMNCYFPPTTKFNC